MAGFSRFFLPMIYPHFIMFLQETVIVKLFISTTSTKYLYFQRLIFPSSFIDCRQSTSIFAKYIKPHFTIKINGYTLFVLYRNTYNPYNKLLYLSFIRKKKISQDFDIPRYLLSDYLYILFQIFHSLLIELGLINLRMLQIRPPHQDQHKPCRDHCRQEIEEISESRYSRVEIGRAHV